jgi:hypothetical protein
MRRDIPSLYGLWLLPTVAAFAPTTTTTNCWHPLSSSSSSSSATSTASPILLQVPFIRHHTKLFSAVEEDVANNVNDYKDVFPTAQFYTFEMPAHRPLGCTVDESMDALENYVFVSKVIPGGFADLAGIHIGDVMVAVTGLFEDMTPVLESGVEKLYVEKVKLL